MSTLGEKDLEIRNIKRDADNLVAEYRILERKFADYKDVVQRMAARASEYERILLQIWSLADNYGTRAKYSPAPLAQWADVQTDLLSILEEN